MDGWMEEEDDESNIRKLIASKNIKFANRSRISLFANVFCLNLKLI